MCNYIGFYTCPCGKNKWKYYAREDEYVCGACGRRLSSTDFFSLYEETDTIALHIDSRIYRSLGGLREKYCKEDIYIDGSKQSMYVCDKCGKNLLIKELPINVSIGERIIRKLNICPKCGRIFFEISGQKLRSCYEYADFHKGLEQIEYLFKSVESITQQTGAINKANAVSRQNIGYSKS